MMRAVRIPVGCVSRIQCTPGASVEASSVRPRSPTPRTSRTSETRPARSNTSSFAGRSSGIVALTVNRPLAGLGATRASARDGVGGRTSPAGPPGARRVKRAV